MTELDCAAHGPFLAAAADGEGDRMPPGTRQHLAACLRCARDVATYRLLSERLREAASRPTTALGTPSSSSRPEAASLLRAGDVRRHRSSGGHGWRASAAAIAAAIVLVVAAQLHSLAADEEVLAIALAAAGAPLEYDSSDPAEIAAWCAQTASRPLPPVALPALVPRGARMDRHQGDLILTVRYVTADGRQLAISWLDALGSSPQDERAQARIVSGRLVLVVRAAGGNALITGDAPLATLWTTAGALAATGR